MKKIGTVLLSFILFSICFTYSPAAVFQKGDAGLMSRAPGPASLSADFFRSSPAAGGVDPGMLIPGLRNIDPGMLRPGNPDIDPKMLIKPQERVSENPSGSDQSSETDTVYVSSAP